jgi:hypothetical protein
VTAPVAPAGPAKVPGRTMRRAGTIVLVLGLVVLVLSVAIGVIVAVVSIRGSIRAVDDGTRFTGSTEVRVEQGDVLQLYRLDGDPTPTCEVTGADGTTPDMAIQSSSVDLSDGSWVSFDQYTATTSQDYTVTCDGDGQVLAAPPLSVGGIFAGVGGILLGVFGGGVGFVAAVVGLVLLLVGRSTMRKAGVS